MKNSQLKELMFKMMLLKHWHLFILAFLFGAFTSPGYGHYFLNFIGLFTFVCWMYSVAVLGNEKIMSYGLPSLKINFFRVNLVVVIATFTTGIFIKTKTVSNLSLTDIPMLLMSIYAGFAVFQNLFFTAKVITILIEKSKGGDYLSKFLAVFFFPIGIWFIQPKLNSIFSTENN